MAITHWHEDDDFWETLGPVFFEEHRWSAVSAEMDGVLGLLDVPPGAAILDLCCGPGRHSLELARRGYAVTGVDRTAAYLEMGREAADGLPVEWVQADMREFCRPDAFAAVVNLYSSFGYFADPADDRRAVENMFRSLQPGGALVLEFQAKEIVARDFRGRDWTDREGVFLLEETAIRPGWGWRDIRWVIVTPDGVGEFRWGHRLYSAQELSRLLQDCGFPPPALYGDFARAPYDNDARRLVAVARKPAEGTG